jgi:hypothetical protein
MEGIKMTIVKCDICGGVIKNSSEKQLPRIEFQILKEDNDGPNGSVAVYPFIAEIKVTHQYNTTNTDICRNCIWKALEGSMIKE